MGPRSRGCSRHVRAAGCPPTAGEDQGHRRGQHLRPATTQHETPARLGPKHTELGHVGGRFSGYIHAGMYPEKVRALTKTRTGERMAATASCTAVVQCMLVVQRIGLRATTVELRTVTPSRVVYRCTPALWQHAPVSWPLLECPPAKLNSPASALLA